MFCSCSTFFFLLNYPINSKKAKCHRSDRTQKDVFVAPDEKLHGKFLILNILKEEVSASRIIYSVDFNLAELHVEKVSPCWILFTLSKILGYQYQNRLSKLPKNLNTYPQYVLKRFSMEMSIVLGQMDELTFHCLALLPTEYANLHNFSLPFLLLSFSLLSPLFLDHS